MDTVENDVKQIILDVSGLEGGIDGLGDTSTLEDLGFNDDMCRSLAQRLNTYVKGRKNGASVSVDDITADMTVADIVKLVKDLLS